MAISLNPKYIYLQSMSTDIIGPSVSLIDVVNISFQSSYSCTAATGVFKVQCSNDNSIWNDITGTSINITSFSSNDNDLIEILNCTFAYIRFVYIASSGTGTLTVIQRSTT